MHVSVSMPSALTEAMATTACATLAIQATPTFQMVAPSSTTEGIIQFRAGLIAPVGVVTLLCNSHLA